MMAAGSEVGLGEEVEDCCMRCRGSRSREREMGF